MTITIDVYLHRKKDEIQTKTFNWNWIETMTIHKYNKRFITKSEITKTASRVSIQKKRAKWKLRRKWRKTRKMCYVIEIQSESIIIRRWTIISNITCIGTPGKLFLILRICKKKGVKIVKVMYLLYVCVLQKH